jgi:hypothetical protein
LLHMEHVLIAQVLQKCSVFCACHDGSPFVTSVFVENVLFYYTI